MGFLNIKYTLEYVYFIKKNDVKAIWYFKRQLLSTLQTLEQTNALLYK